MWTFSPKSGILWTNHTVRHSFSTQTPRMWKNCALPLSSLSPDEATGTESSLKRACFKDDSYQNGHLILKKAYFKDDSYQNEVHDHKNGPISGRQCTTTGKVNTVAGALV